MLVDNNLPHLLCYVKNFFHLIKNFLPRYLNTGIIHFMECLKDLVKRLREEKGLSQRQLALLAETNNTDISNVETGKTKYFRHDFLRKLAKALNVSTLMLLQAAGYIASDEELPPDAILLEELEKKYHAIPATADADYALTVCGDSMEPRRAIERLNTNLLRHSTLLFYHTAPQRAIISVVKVW